MGKNNKLSGKIKSRSHHRICEWCGDDFLGMKDGRFCSTHCVRQWRTDKSWTTSKCLHCGNDFKHRKKDGKNGNSRMFCSNECSRSSDYKKELTRKQLIDHNPMDIQENRDKIKQTKLGRYGDENYNNIDKAKETNIKKYGVPYTILLGRANGIRISRGQQELYDEYKKKHKDAILEHWLKDIQKSVDIFIPSTNTIIEYYGRYWHCDPNKYDPDYMHPSRHQTAKEIWEKDAERERQLKKAGYNVTVEWEN